MLPSGGRVIMFITVQIRKFTIQSIHFLLHVWITGTANREVHLPLTNYLLQLKREAADSKASESYGSPSRTWHLGGAEEDRLVRSPNRGLFKSLQND